MLTKSYIKRTLNTLNSKYNKTTSTKENLLTSKLAMLELCGWLEESMDAIVEDFAKKNLKDQKDLKFIKEQIRRNHGFAYENFKRMLINLIGLVTFLKLEKSLDQSKLVLFVSSLSTLKTIRDSAAHTHLKGVTITLDSPSKSIYHFNNLYEGLSEFNNALKNLSL